MIWLKVYGKGRSFSRKLPPILKSEFFSFFPLPMLAKNWFFFLCTIFTFPFSKSHKKLHSSQSFQGGIFKSHQGKLISLIFSLSMVEKNLKFLIPITVHAVKFLEGKAKFFYSNSWFLFFFTCIWVV